MKRGRRPKPNAIKKLEGNRGRREIRDEAIKPPPRSSAMAAPKHLGAIGAGEWRRLAPQLHLLGLLTDFDAGVFTAYCQAFDRWRKAELRIVADGKKNGDDGLIITTSNGNAIQNPAVGIANKAMELMCRYAAEFGFTPSARSRVSNSIGTSTPRQPGAAAAAARQQKQTAPSGPASYFDN